VSTRRNPQGIFSAFEAKFLTYYKQNFNLCFILEKQSQSLAKMVSVDKMNFSISFNEFLKLMSMQQASEPDSEVLLDVFA